jgi:hypothetical protein
MNLHLSSLDAVDAARRADPEQDDARSVAAALRATLVFLAIIGLLAWAGIAEAQVPNAVEADRGAAAGAPTA